MSLTAHAYVLAAPDLGLSSRYFIDVLGFQIEWTDADRWHCVARDGVRLMIGHCPAALPPADLGDHSYFAYWRVADVDAFYAEIAARGALIRRPPHDTSYGMREMWLGTPDGFRIMVGTPMVAAAS